MKIFNPSKRSNLLAWILANLVIAMIAIGIYSSWRPIIDAHAFYFSYFQGPQSDLKSSLILPFKAIGQSYPAFFVLILLLQYLKVWRIMPLQQHEHIIYLFIAFNDCLLRVVLSLAAIYNSTGERQNLWVLPLVIPALGIMIKEVVLWKVKYAKIAILILVVILFLDIMGKNEDRGELGMLPPSAYEEVQNTLGKFGPHDVVDTVLVEGIGFTNLFRNMSEMALTGRQMAAIAPYNNTHILFNPYYDNDFSTGIMLATLTQARDLHMLDNIDRIIFMQEAWRTPIVDLILCPVLEKQVFAIPPLTKKELLTRQTLSGMLFLIVSKKTVLEDILPLNGKARSCLNQHQDMIPGFIPQGF